MSKQNNQETKYSVEFYTLLTFLGIILTSISMILYTGYTENIKMIGVHPSIPMHWTPLVLGVSMRIAVQYLKSKSIKS